MPPKSLFPGHVSVTVFSRPAIESTECDEPENANADWLHIRIYSVITRTLIESSTSIASVNCLRRKNAEARDSRPKTVSKVYINKLINVSYTLQYNYVLGCLFLSMVN